MGLTSGRIHFYGLTGITRKTLKSVALSKECQEDLCSLQDSPQTHGPDKDHWNYPVEKVWKSSYVLRKDKDALTDQTLLSVPNFRIFYAIALSKA